MQVHDHRWFLIFVALFAELLSGCRSENQHLLDLLNQGDLELRAGRFELAVEAYSRAIELNAEYVAALNNRGIAYQKSGDYDRSHADYTQALAVDPDFHDARFNRVLLALDNNQYHAALDDLWYLERTYPDSMKVFFSMGLASSQIRDYEKAIYAFTRAITLESRNAELLINRATVNYYLNNLSEAKNDLLSALHIGSHDAEANNTLAMVMVTQGSLDSALYYVELALEQEPESPYFLNNRGYILIKQSRLEEAMADIDHSIRLDPQNAWAYRNKGLFQQALGNDSAALDLYFRSLQMDDFVQESTFLIGSIYLQRGDKDRACKYFRESAELREIKGVTAVASYCN